MIRANHLLQFSKITDMASSVIALLSGSIDAVTSILFAILNVIFTIVFQTLFLIIYALHQILLEFVLIRPVPRDSSGDIVVMGTGVEEPFTSFSSVINGYLEPFAMVIVLLGVAVLLFVRIFDVVIEDGIGINVQDAQQRLLIAPIFILLWIPIANIILSLGYGLTEIFINMNVSFNPSSFTALNNVFLDAGNNLDIKGYVLSIAPSNPVSTFTADTTLSMLVGITMMAPAALIYIIGVVAAAFRIVGIYVFYIVGPLSIALWAFAWRDLSSIGKRYIKYFILLALFPVPAALLNTLIPIIALAIENALMAALGGSFATGGSSSTSLGSAVGISSNPINALGLGGIIRALMIVVIPAIIGFAPWVFVIGVNGAMKVAGGAAVGTAAVATGGAVAMGASSSMLSKGASAAKSGAMNRSSRVRSAAKKGSQIKGSVGQKAGNISSKAKQMGSRVPGSGKAKMGAQYAVTGASYAKKHRKNIQRGAADVAQKHSNNSAINSIASGVKKEADIEDDMRNKLTKARDTFGGLKNIDKNGQLTQEGALELDRQVLSDKMTLSQSKAALNTIDGFSYDENMTKDEMKQKASKAVHELYENSDSRTEVKDTLGDSLENSISGDIENIKYNDLLEKAQEKGLEDAFLSSDYVNGNLSGKNEEVSMAQSDQSELYSENWDIFNQSGLSDKEYKAAVNETEKARDAVEADIDVGSLESVDGTDDLLDTIFGDSKLESYTDNEEVVTKMVNKMSEDANMTQLKELDSVQALDEEGVIDAEGIDNSESLAHKVTTSIQQGNMDYEVAQDVSESMFKEMYFKDTVSDQKLNEEIDSFNELDRTKVDNIVSEKSQRPETARKGNMEKVVKSLENPGEYYDTEESFNKILGELDRNVRKEIQGKIQQVKPGESLEDVNIDVEGEQKKLMEELIEPVRTGLKSVGNGELAEEIANDPKDFEPVVREAVTDMSIMSDSNISDLADKTEDLQKEALGAAVDCIQDYDVTQEMRDIIERKGSLSESDINSLSQDAVENLTVGVEATKVVDEMDGPIDGEYSAAALDAMNDKNEKGTAQTLSDLRNR